MAKNKSKRRKKAGIKKLSTKLMVYFIIPMLLVFLVTDIVCLYITARGTTELVKQEVFNDANQTVGKMQDIFEDIEEQIGSGRVESVARKYSQGLTNTSDYKSSKNYVTMQSVLDTINNGSEVLSSAGYIDFEHSLGFSDTENGWVKYNWDVEARQWYDSKKIVQDRTYISHLHELLFDKKDGEYVSIVNPVLGDGGNVIGVLIASVDISRIRSTLRKQVFGEEGYSILIDDEGKIIYHPSQDKIGTTLSKWIDGNEIMEKDEVVTLRLDGQMTYAKYSQVKSTDWSILSVIPKAEVQSRIEKYIHPVASIYMISALLMIGLFAVVSRTIVRPIKQITKTTKEIAQGNYNNKLKVKSSDEIGQLASAFNSTIITLRYRADYDELTGIYNSQTMFRETEAMLRKHPDNQYAIICMDVNHFKLVNDLLGWEKGDELLKHIAHVLTSQLPHDSIYARVRSDIFCICMRYEEREELVSTVTRLRDEVEGYYSDIDVAPFFGICIVEDIDTPVNLMCDWADMALKSIKGNMIQFYAFYDEQLRDTMINNKIIESEMYSALEQQQFFVMIQPKCDINSGKVIGAEALVRWQHPERGMIPPDAFIPVFEEDGFVLQLDEFVWEETCKAMRTWLDKGYEVVPISVNVSRLHIFDTELVPKLLALVEKYDLPTRLLELELTESAFLNNVDELYELMNKLKDAGFTLSMDDFGSGYSSLNMLKDAPFDVVKFDREFLNESVNSEKGKTILDSMITMVNRLSIRVLVEGVETKEQTKILLEAGCHIAQGYYYSRPIKIEEFEEFAYGAGNPHVMKA